MLHGCVADHDQFENVVGGDAGVCGAAHQKLVDGLDDALVERLQAAGFGESSTGCET